MFTFFRNETLSINPGYWSEKLESVDRHCGFEEFDEYAFKSVVMGYLKDWIRNGGLDKNDRRELWEEVQENVLGRVDGGVEVATNSAYDFSYTVGGKTFQFEDFFEHKFTKFNRHFLWCCYALVWGIDQYDSTK